MPQTRESAPPTDAFGLTVTLNDHTANTMSPRSLMKWRASDELAAQIIAQSMRAPNLLVTLQRKRPAGLDSDLELWCDVATFVFPFVQGWGQIKTRRAEDQRIIATVIDLGQKRHLEMALRWAAREENKYFPANLYDDDGTPNTTMFEDMPFIRTSYQRDLHIDQSKFAAQPTAWMFRLVQLYYPADVDDTCHFGDRVLISLARAAGGVIFGTLWRLITMAVVLFFGMRYINWAYLIPLNREAKPIRADKVSSSIYFKTKKRKVRPLPFCVLNPVTVFTFPALAWAAIQLMKVAYHHYHGQGWPDVTWGWWRTVEIIDGGLLGLAVGLALLWLLGVAAWMLLKLLPQPTSDATEVAVREDPPVDLAALRSQIAGVTGTTIQPNDRRWWHWLIRGQLRLTIAYIKQDRCQMFAQRDD